MARVESYVSHVTVLPHCFLRPPRCPRGLTTADGNEAGNGMTETETATETGTRTVTQEVQGQEDIVIVDEGGTVVRVAPGEVR